MSAATTPARKITIRKDEMRVGDGRARRLILGHCRNFLQRSYPTMKKHNPHTPILIREASGFEPTLFARYSTFRPYNMAPPGQEEERKR
jgi:hypothetical protein